LKFSVNKVAADAGVPAASVAARAVSEIVRMFFGSRPEDAKAHALDISDS
jgi:hypothetical protein